MPDDRRNRIACGAFFFTVSLFDRRSNLLVTHINALRDAARRKPRAAKPCGCPARCHSGSTRGGLRFNRRFRTVFSAVQNTANLQQNHRAGRTASSAARHPRQRAPARPLDRGQSQWGRFSFMRFDRCRIVASKDSGGLRQQRGRSRPPRARNTPTMSGQARVCRTRGGMARPDISAVRRARISPGRPGRRRGRTIRCRRAENAAVRLEPIIDDDRNGGMRSAVLPYACCAYYRLRIF